jgi:hypothetical protein
MKKLRRLTVDIDFEAIDGYADAGPYYDTAGWSEHLLVG